ncbi:MAG: phosphatase PAP2 family protein [Thermotogota bacterium]
MELEILKSIQSFANPFWDNFFEFFTIFGEELIVIPVLTFIFWIIDKKFGEYLGFAVFTSFLVNNSLKDIFQFKRPIGEEGIRSLRTHTATGYAFPSGHTQGAASFYSAISIYLNKKLIYFIAGIIIFFVGYSRLYLGVHYPKDVIAGIIIGIGVSYFTYLINKKIKNKLLVYYIIFIIGLFLLFFSNSPDYIKALGTYFGFVNGIYIEKKFVDFNINISFIKKIFRYIIGLAIILVLKEGLKLILPNEILYYFIRYFLITFIGIGIYPYIFNKLKF